MYRIVPMISLLIVFLLFGCGQTQHVQKDVKVIFVDKTVDEAEVDEYKYYYQVTGMDAREIKAFVHKESDRCFITVEKKSATSPIKYLFVEESGKSAVSSISGEFSQNIAGIDEAVQTAVKHYIQNHVL